MAVIRKRVQKTVRRTRLGSSKPRNFAASGGGGGTTDQQMDSEALLAAEAIFCMYDEAEKPARAKG